MVTRDDILAEARGWIGTPYRHQASCKGAGADCLGLVRGVWRALYGEEPEPLPPYSRDWAEAEARETLLEAARRHMREVAPERAGPGDLLLFRWRDGAPVKHAGLLATAADAPAPAFLHAYEGLAVTESPLITPWRRRIAAAFLLPGISPWQP
jgi:NlpC/P60 family putative phage cell wall peptidase